VYKVKVLAFGRAIANENFIDKYFKIQAVFVTWERNLPKDEFSPALRW
jgi:hypothetical protein